jgi:O-antigen/teichoic acid export membrane protein
VNLKVILRNIFSNWAGYAITVVIGFFLSPFVVHRLGQTGYGVWTLIVSLTGYFGVLDLGLRQSVGRFISRHVAQQDSASVNRTLSTAFTMLAAAGFLAIAASIAAALNFDRFHVEPQYRDAARTALLIAGFNIGIALPCSVLSTVLAALERYDLMNAIAVLGVVTRAVLVIVALRSGYGLVTLALITLAVGLIEYSVTAFSAKRLYPPLRLSLGRLDSATGKELFGFGIYRFIWIIANQLIFYTDTVVIGLFINAAAITSYAIAGTLVNYGRTLVSMASDVYYPVTAKLDSNNDLDGLRKVYLFGTNVALIIGLPVCLGFLFFGRQFITLWMGAEYAGSALFLTVLTIAQFTSVTQYTAAQVLVGMAKHKLLAQVAIAEGVANLVLSVVLIQRIGLVGVAWGTVIPHLVTTGIVVPLYTARILKLPMSTYLVKGCLRPVICAVPTAALCWWLSRQPPTDTWALFVKEVLLVAAVFGTLAYFLCIDRERRESLRRSIAQVLRRRAAHQT